MQVAWPGVQPSPTGGGGAPAAQELESIEPAEEPAIEEDELIPPKPTSGIAQEEALTSEMIPKPSPTPVFEDILPSSPAMELEQPTIQDVSAAPILDLNEDQPQEDHDI